MPTWNRGNGAGFRWLMEHVAHDGDECLFWPLSRDSHGYGQFGLNGKTYKAHRFMCVQAHGEPPLGKPVARHSCGNGHLGCVNPRHLSWATNSDNQRDRRKHGRHLGAIGTRTTLTPQDIDYIRRSRGVISQSELATQFNVKIGRIKYWQGHTRDPLPPSTNPYVVKRRKSPQSATQREG